MYIMYTINTNGLLILNRMLSALNDDACIHIYTLLYKEHTHRTLSLLYNVIDVRSAVVACR